MDEPIEYSTVRPRFAFCAVSQSRTAWLAPAECGRQPVEQPPHPGSDLRPCPRDAPYPQIVDLVEGSPAGGR
jgi:hypothetical protein